MSPEDAVVDVDERPVPATDLATRGHPGCSVCNQPATDYCRRCRNMWYCSKECLQNDKRFRQALCRDFANFSVRPTQERRSYFRAIYFPAFGDFPQLVWLEHFGERTMFEPSPVQITRLMDGEYKAYIKFDCHRELRRSLDYQIEIFYGARPSTNGSHGNRSLRHLLPEDLADRWDGSFLTRAVTTLEDTPIDLDTNALPAILAYLSWMSKHHSLYPGKVYALDTVIGDVLILRLSKRKSKGRRTWSNRNCK